MNTKSVTKAKKSWMKTKPAEDVCYYCNKDSDLINFGDSETARMVCAQCAEPQEDFDTFK